MQPLTIYIDVLTPIGHPLRKISHPVHLDGIVIAQLALRDKRIFDPKASDPYAPGTGVVPLRVVGNKSPIYQASVGYSETLEQSYFAFTKKSPCDDKYFYHLGKKTFRRGGASSGENKGWAENIIVTHPGRRLKFRCVGLKAELESLLGNIAGLGFMRRIGLGEVIKVQVTETKTQDIDTWGLISDEGCPMRELPEKDWPAQPGWNSYLLASRPPYWYPGNYEFCYAPNYRQVIPGY